MVREINLFELYAKISVDDTNFKKSMENAQKSSKNVAKAVKELQSPLDKTKSTFNSFVHPVETAISNFQKLKDKTESVRHPLETLKSKLNETSTALETKRNKLSVLSSSYDNAKKKVNDLTKEFNKSAKESGTSSEKTQELAKKLNEAEKEAEEAKKELDDYSVSVSKAGKNSDSASNRIGNFAEKLGKGLKTAAKVGTAAVGVATSSIVALTKAAVDNYAEYEQLVGGVQTLFNQTELSLEEYAKMVGKTTDEALDEWNELTAGARIIQNNADEAFKNAGLSANEYMSTVTSFSASLIQSLRGDTVKAANYADQAIIDMADNANKMGTSMEMIQNALTYRAV